MNDTEKRRRARTDLRGTQTLRDWGEEGIIKRDQEGAPMEVEGDQDL